MTGEHESLLKLIDCFKIVADISQRQVALAQKAGPENDISDDFLVLVEQRDRLQQEIENIITALPGQRDNPGLDRKHPQGQQIFELAVLIDKNDTQTRLFVETFLESIGNKLQALRTNKKALKAYSPQTKPQPWFFDNKK